MTPIASFLAGSLLSILIPACLLIALGTWYWVVIRDHGEPADVSSLGRSGAEASGADQEVASPEAAGLAASPPPGPPQPPGRQ